MSHPKPDVVDARTAKRGTKVGRAGSDPRSIAKRIDPLEYADYFRSMFLSAPYYSAGRVWHDYAPAYQYGYDTFDAYRGQRFEDVEARLQDEWEAARANSRLGWSEARGAVRDSWYQIEHSLPGTWASH
ncbi:MAG: hypothetical protein ABJA62_05695 [Luteimonas sp.]